MCGTFLSGSSLLRVSPLLLGSYAVPRFGGTCRSFLRCFENFITLAGTTEDGSAGSGFFGEVMSECALGRVSGAKLNCSAKGAHKENVDKTLSVRLTRDACSVVGTKVASPRVFYLVRLVRSGVKPSEVDSVAVSVLRRRFLTCARHVDTRLGLPAGLCECSCSLSFGMPFCRGGPVLFVPARFLYSLPCTVSCSSVSEIYSCGGELGRGVTDVVNIY